MLNIYQFEYNGNVPEHFNGFLLDYPSISTGKRRYSTITIPHQNGQLITNELERDNISITCVIGVLGNNLQLQMDNIRRWLRGTGKLILSDQQDRYYQVLAVDMEGLERQLRQYGQFSVTFTCYPYAFMNDGQKYLDGGKIYNPYDGCMPTYYITGNGTAQLNVNGKTITADVNNNITLDSRLMLAYKKKGETILNTAVTGFYEDLWLKSGHNDISINNGFSVQVQPFWGWLL